MRVMESTLPSICRRSEYTPSYYDQSRPALFGLPLKPLCYMPRATKVVP